MVRTSHTAPSKKPPSLHSSIPGKDSTSKFLSLPLSLPVHSVHLHQWCCRSVLFCVLCCMVRVLGLSSSPPPPLVPPVLPPCSLGVDHNHRCVRYFSHISTGTNTRCAHSVNAFIDGFLFISSFFISSEPREGLGKSTYFSMINNWRIVTLPEGTCLAVPCTTF